MVALLEAVAPSRQQAAVVERSGDLSQLVEFEVRRLIERSGLPKDLRAAVVAQFERREPGAGRWKVPFGAVTAYAYESAGGFDPDMAASAAAAVEFTSAAASVLDDLQDLDEVPGINRDVPGSGAELVALLMSLANKAMASLDQSGLPCERVLAASRVLAEFEIEALKGQHLANQIGLNVDRLMDRASAATEEKSGWFGRLAAEIGATLATDDATLIEWHGDFGHHLAVIDQLQNDVAGVWPGGDPSSDIGLGRATPALVFALEVPHGVNEAADEVKDALRSSGTGDARDEARVREAMFRSGAVHYAWIVAAVHKAKASAIASRCVDANPNSRIAELLVA